MLVQVRVVTRFESEDGHSRQRLLCGQLRIELNDHALNSVAPPVPSQKNLTGPCHHVMFSVSNMSSIA